MSSGIFRRLLIRQLIENMEYVKIGACNRGCWTIYFLGMTRCPGCVAFEYGLATGEWASP